MRRGIIMGTKPDPIFVFVGTGGAGSQQTAGGSAGTFDMTIHSGWAAGDFALLFRVGKGGVSATAHSTPSGWTFIRTDQTAIGSLKTTIFWRELDASTNCALPALASGDGNGNNIMVVYKNIASYNSMYGTTINSTSTSNFVMPNITNTNLPIITVGIGNTTIAPAPSDTSVRVHRGSGYISTPGYIPFIVGDILKPTTTSVSENVPVGATTAGQTTYNIAVTPD